MFLNRADGLDTQTIVKVLSQAAEKYKASGFKAFVFFLKKDERRIKELNHLLEADNIALGVIPLESQQETLDKYKIHKKAKSTIIIYKDLEVTANFVNFDSRRDTPLLKNALKAIVAK